MSFRITLIWTSLSLSVASWAFSLASVAMFMAWPATPMKVPSLPRSTRGLATGTAITMSAQVLRATSTGTLRTSMPSTSSRPSIFHRGESRRHRHAGAHRHGQIALVEDHHLAGFEVRGHGPERNRQVIEITHLIRAGDDAPEHALDLVRGNETARRDHLAVLQAEFEAVGEGEVAALAMQRHLLARRTGQDFLPFDRGDDLLDFGGGQAGGIGRADDRAHRGARDAIDRECASLPAP